MISLQLYLTTNQQHVYCTVLLYLKQVTTLNIHINIDAEQINEKQNNFITNKTEQEHVVLVVKLFV